MKNLSTVTVPSHRIGREEIYGIVQTANFNAGRMGTHALFGWVGTVKTALLKEGDTMETQDNAAPVVVVGAVTAGCEFFFLF